MRRILLILALVIAGELAFGLVFNVPRFFRPTMLEVFGFTNTQLGDMFAIYGIAAMIAYFPGGAVADRFSARSLMTTSLVATSIGGLYMATIPGAAEMKILYGYWGISTIFLFWSALIRATRDWGGHDSQGVAFGVLEGGRGLVAASAAAIGVTILSLYLPENARLATDEEREAGFRTVVLFYSLLTILAAVFTWVAIPEEKRASDIEFDPLKNMGIVMRRPVVWAQAAIIVCAYCGYKGLDNYSLYAVQVLGMDEVEGARLASYGAWTRPVAAILAGLIADRFNATRSIQVMFVVLCIAFGTWSMAAPSGSGLAIVYVNFFLTYIVVYALRGIYFALLEENRTPKFLTGAAVGLVSLVGYTPDVFFGPITGRILDADPGIVGHQNYFLFLSGVSLVGVLMVAWLVWLRRLGTDRLWPQSTSSSDQVRQ
jgi:sugar phosphate permease